ncbi:MAG TPA: hypothetical protein DCZ40_12155 [Lachnospiraceae bacterium]|nr:hypothetical protein [Lachnospiraceae bacterium]
MTYEQLLIQADSEYLIVKEKPLFNNDGRIKGNRIAIRKSIPTIAEKSCVLAEELGHYYTTSGDILDQSKTENRKQELRARLWAYNNMVGLVGIVNAFKHGCRNLYETAEYLEVTEEFLQEALSAYRSKYGICKELDNYIVFFIPHLAVLKKFQE